MKTDGYHLYQIEFVYRQKAYLCELKSTAVITAETDPVIARDLVDDAIKERMQTIPDKTPGIYPHSIVIIGEFGKLALKD